MPAAAPPETRVSPAVLSAVLGLALVASACGSSAPVVAEAPVVAAAPAAPPPVMAPAASVAELGEVTSRNENPALDTVRAGRFDSGRMFTLDNPPRAYFREAYGFEPSDGWFDRARLGALRFATYCSASFVSPEGLVLTNHHCARQSVTEIGLLAGRDYNAEGFVARSRGEEVRVPGLFVEQLLAIDDVTALVDAAGAGAADAAARQQARGEAVQRLQAERTAAAGEGRRVQVIQFYAGSQARAYTFRRYDDVRMVFAPETALGYFGGDPDNFTYPRYSLDFALLRAYDASGQPVRPEAHFPFHPGGTVAGEPVFVVGNPGTTTRLHTVAQLEFRRDVTEPALLDFLASRERVFGDFIRANPGHPETPTLTDTYFSLGNGRKAYTGRVAGLRDPYLLARRRAAERDFSAALAADAAAQADYGDVLRRIATNRAAARSSASEARAFTAFGPASPYNGTAMSRALAFVAGGMAATEEAFARVADQPAAVQEGLIAARFQDMLAHLGPNDRAVQALLAGRTPSAAARAIVAGSRLGTAETAQAARESGALADDPAVQAAAILLPRLREFQQSQQAANAELAEQGARLARARFRLYGTDSPPDATFSLRIADGVVRGYDYNGTVAPPYTTFYGLYDRFESQCTFTGAPATCDWHLPANWQQARANLTLSTPLNFVSSNDIIGGNSGSPVLNRDLQVVGIAFDGNIESLPGDYIYTDEANRTVSVDVRGMIEAMRTVYRLDGLVTELTGQPAPRPRAPQAPARPQGRR